MIVINAPMGAKGHQMGRLLASCDNVAWYNTKGNGEHPWLPYTEMYGKDLNFTKYHWNRCFKNGTKVIPVLDMAERQGLSTGSYDALKGPIGISISLFNLVAAGANGFVKIKSCFLSNVNLVLTWVSSPSTTRL